MSFMSAIHKVYDSFESVNFKNNQADLISRFSRYKLDNLENISNQDFMDWIGQRVALKIKHCEGFSNAEYPIQRDYSTSFTWGHNHDFGGGFKLEGQMKNRHITVMADFMDLFELDPGFFRSKAVLDVGCWTGGTSLLLASVGASVSAIDEVSKYIETVNFLASSFGLKSVKATPQSLYDLDATSDFDLVYMPGVVYHLSDPVVGLRILYNSLQDGGSILVESAGVKSKMPICLFKGNKTIQQDELAGWAWFWPSPAALKRMMLEAGFVKVTSVWHKRRGRVYAIGQKDTHRPIVFAGLSRRDV